MFPARSRAHLLQRVAAASLALAVPAFHAARAAAQQPPVRPDTVPLRADYRDLAELLQKLPPTPPPAFDESRALWLGALPLTCLDRLQPRPGGRGGRAGTAPVSPTDSTGRAGGGRATGVAADSSGRAGGRGAGGATNNGAGYFWVASYSLVPDHDRLRAFWGCSDWHSAVGATWATVRLLKSYPNSALHELAREKLNAHLGKSNLAGELAFFRAAAAAINPIPSAATQGGLFERPYGFAWLLKLHSELSTWPDSQGKRWAANVAPLATWMADSLSGYLSRLVEPMRTGTQANTALSMTLALDYADVASDIRLRGTVVRMARKFFLADTACATQSERVATAAGGRGGRGGRGGGRGTGRGAVTDSTPRAPNVPNDLSAVAATPARGGAAPGGPGGGPEIHSPCLTEAALMSRVLESHAYVAWLEKFLPPMQSGKFAPLTEAVNIPTAAPPAAPTPALGAAPDTSAAAAAAALATERARLAGLSFARAQAMERIARALSATDPRVAAWHRLSAIQADRGFELARDDVAGVSWLPAQALLYVSVRK